MTSTFARILSELSDPTSSTGMHGWNEHSPFALASLADCASPDSIESPGAKFLGGVARDVADRAQPYTTSEPTPADVYRARLDELTGDDAHELADSAVPVYTYDRWLTFVDLAAWQEDISDYGSTDDLTNAAGVALYMIAERLVRALAEELTEALDTDSEESEDADLEADLIGPVPIGGKTDDGYDL
jgi:hypothetical protein